MTDQEIIKELRKENAMLRSNLTMADLIARQTMVAAKMPVEDVDYGPGMTMKDLPKCVGALRIERDRLFRKCGKPSRG